MTGVSGAALRYPVRPGCEPFAYEGGPIGVLLLHGYSGSPASLRPMGEWLAREGYSVAGPRLPGHGTEWRELADTAWQDIAGEAERALKELSGRCEVVVVAGLSVGGLLAFHLAAHHAPPLVAGVVAVNPYVRNPIFAFLPLVRRIRRRVKGVINDIKREGQDELGYEVLPVAGIAQLARLMAVVQKELPDVRCPVRVFLSDVDHVVPKGTVRWAFARLGSRDKELIELHDSYHVATLDNDAESIFQGTHAFVERVAGAARAATPPPRRRRAGEGDRRPRRRRG
jgi:carboxylesterase